MVSQKQNSNRVRRTRRLFKTFLLLEAEAQNVLNMFKVDARFSYKIVLIQKNSVFYIREYNLLT